MEQGKNLAKLQDDALAGPRGLVKLIRGWRALERADADVTVLGDGVSDAEMQRFGAREGVTLPPALAVIYRNVGGVIAVPQVNVELYGWPPATLSDMGVPVDGEQEPPQLRWIGGDAGMQLFGVWLPRPGGSVRAPAVVARQIGLHDLVVAASGVVELLLETTVVFLQLDRPPGTDEALEAMEVPKGLRDGDPADDSYTKRVVAWADPSFAGRNFYFAAEGCSQAELPEAIAAVLPA